MEVVGRRDTTSQSRQHRQNQFVLIAAFFLFLSLGILPAFATSKKAPDCNQPASSPLTMVKLPGHPFEPVVTHDVCWIFTSMIGPASGVAVLRRAGGKVTLARVARLTPRGPAGMVLTHDAELLIATTGDSVVFLSTRRLISGSGDPVLGRISDGQRAGSVYVNVTRDDRFAFVSDERIHSITVIDLAKARKSGFSEKAVVGKIPTGLAPIALTFSEDGRYLYTTSELALASWGWPNDCTPEGPAADRNKRRWPEGAVEVVDAVKARTDPEDSVLSKAAAGCSPVRLVLSPDGKFAYVTVRHNNELAAFDTAKLISDPAHALIGHVAVGTAPVGVAVVDGGKKVVVTNSNRFAGKPRDRQPLTVIDAGKITSGNGAVLGTISAGAFPRELRVTADRRTLLVTNFMSNTLELVDLKRLPLHRAPAAGEH
jgi:DNA-binding beta-propeller fold protein YncE